VKAVSIRVGTIGKMASLLHCCSELYGRFEHESFLVRPSIPILFFGDSTKYFSSPLKIITVGLNPSKAEFPESDRFARFPQAAPSGFGHRRLNMRHHIEAMNAYFQTHPYKQWFSSYEALLSGLDCSFYGVRTNTALHTDLCSPLATDPTWSGLVRGQQSILEAGGAPLWHALVELLSPDLILISVARRHLGKIQFRRSTPCRVIYSVDRKKRYDVEGLQLSLSPSRRALLVFGRAAQKPFGTVSNADRLKIGAFIKDRYYAG
jgi:hypothetical protein